MYTVLSHYVHCTLMLYTLYSHTMYTMCTILQVKRMQAERERAVATVQMKANEMVGGLQVQPVYTVF
jgi:hypothetical protein